MKTFCSQIQQLLIEAGFVFKKEGDVWKLIDNGKVLLENRRLGELLSQADKELGGFGND